MDLSIMFAAVPSSSPVSVPGSVESAIAKCSAICEISRTSRCEIFGMSRAARAMWPKNCLAIP